MDGILTSYAMIRYNERQNHIPPTHSLAQFMDETYDDAWMQQRWPNMIVIQKEKVS